jgi:hypothetical protein
MPDHQDGQHHKNIGKPVIGARFKQDRVPDTQWQVLFCEWTGDNRACHDGIGRRGDCSQKQDCPEREPQKPTGQSGGYQPHADHSKRDKKGRQVPKNLDAMGFKPQRDSHQTDGKRQSGCLFENRVLLAPLRHMEPAKSIRPSCHTDQNGDHWLLEEALLKDLGEQADRNDDSPSHNKTDTELSHWTSSIRTEGPS